MFLTAYEKPIKENKSILYLEFRHGIKVPFVHYITSCKQFKPNYMTLKELDIKLRHIVEHYIYELPEFNTGDPIIDFVSRLKYTSENKGFLNDINSVVDQYLMDKENLTMREKEQWKFIKEYHRKKYEYGINSPFGNDLYQSLFSNQ